MSFKQMPIWRRARTARVPAPEPRPQDAGSARVLRALVAAFAVQALCVALAAGFLAAGAAKPQRATLVVSPVAQEGADGQQAAPAASAPAQGSASVLNPSLLFASLEADGGAAIGISASLDGTGTLPPAEVCGVIVDGWASPDGRSALYLARLDADALSRALEEGTASRVPADGGQPVEGLKEALAALAKPEAKPEEEVETKPEEEAEAEAEPADGQGKAASSARPVPDAGAECYVTESYEHHHSSKDCPVFAADVGERGMSYNKTTVGRAEGPLGFAPCPECWSL